MHGAIPPAILLLLSALILRADEAQEQRIRQLERKLMAPCCYQTPLADHHSETAVQMKVEIASWVAEGRSDQEIIDEYKSRYGARILAVSDHLKT